MLNVFLMGAGDKGTQLLDQFLNLDWVKVIGISDIKSSAPGLFVAEENGIPVFIEDSLDYLEKLDIDLVFDLTEDPAIASNLLNMTNGKFNIATGETAALFMNLIRQENKQKEEIKESLEEHQILAEVALKLSEAETSDNIFETIVNGGMNLAGVPAASLSIYNDSKDELFLVYAKGFSTEFYQHAIDLVRTGGLTEHVLSKKEPFVVSNVEENPSFNNSLLIKEGVKSLIGVPLAAQDGPMGILFLDDFKPREFSQSCLDILKLLASRATLAIQKQQALEKLKTLSIRDPLTGLYNRRYFMEILTLEIDRALRLNHPLSAIIFDIDHFKKINDKFGHLAGDRVIQSLARLFKSSVRKYDTFARFGGDEFLILLPDADGTAAMKLCERLKSSISNAKLLPDDSAVTCSFGIHTLSESETKKTTPDEFLHHADTALYESKQNGRNKISFSPNNKLKGLIIKDQKNRRPGITRIIPRNSSDR
ncbi:MAG: diguanylate cyclase [Nitrospirae bacterium]|nr:diguanylate cyclase [Nitrospirota bacterium]